MSVGRNSGALELGDARRSESRSAVKAHSVRIEHIAFGAGDGIVLTSSAGSNMMGLDPEGVPKVWDARSGELLLALPGEWIGGPMIAAPVPGFYLVSSDDELRVYDHAKRAVVRSEEHTSELQSLMRISYAVFCLKKKKTTQTKSTYT